MSETSLVELLGQGGVYLVFAVLFVWLFFETRKESRAREDAYQRTIQDLNGIIKTDIGALARAVTEHDTWARTTALNRAPSHDTAPVHIAPSHE